MARQGNLYISHRPIREKLAYEEFMYGYKETLTLDGRMYVYPKKQRKSDDNYMGMDVADNLLDTEAQKNSTLWIDYLDMYLFHNKYLTQKSYLIII